MLCPANADASNLEAQLSPNARGWPFAAEGGVLPPAGRRVMLCLVLMAVELVIVSSRVQSANYTAYKPSTGRQRAAAPGRWAAPTPWPLAGGPRVSGRVSPRAMPDGAWARAPGRGAWEDAPDPACTLVRPPRTLGVARPAGSTLRGPAPPGRAPPPNSRCSRLHPRRRRVPAPVSRASQGPSPQLSFPCPFLYAFSGPAPTSSLPRPLRPRKLFSPQPKP